MATMREMFRQHHRLSEAERAALWREGSFAFDTNALLNIYRYGDATRDDFFEVLRALRDRIWIPHQVAHEFYRRRLDVIQSQRAKYEEVISTLEAAVSGLRNGGFRKSAFLNLDALEALIRPGVEQAQKVLQEQREQHPDLVHDDPYLEALVEVVGSSVGGAYDTERLEALFTDAESRITAQQPPGYRDAKKPVPDRYGDILIWFQLLERAAETKKPLVFITDDEKDDWWLTVNGQKLGPRPELREEMHRRTGVDFYLYKPAYLLEIAGREFKLQVAESSIDDAKETGAAWSRDRVEALRADSGLDQHPIRHQPSKAWADRRATLANATSAVREWLVKDFLATETTDGRGALTLFASFGDGRYGFSVRLLTPNASPAWLKMRLQEASLLAYHEISQGQIIGFYHVYIARNLDMTQRSAEVLMRSNKENPAYPIILGYVDNAGTFVYTRILEPA